MILFYMRITKQCGREPTMCDVGDIGTFYFFFFLFFIKSLFCHYIFFLRAVHCTSTGLHFITRMGVLMSILANGKERRGYYFRGCLDYGDVCLRWAWGGFYPFVCSPQSLSLLILYYYYYCCYICA